MHQFAPQHSAQFFAKPLFAVVHILVLFNCNSSLQTSSGGPVITLYAQIATVKAAPLVAFRSLLPFFSVWHFGEFRDQAFMHISPARPTKVDVVGPPER